MFQPGDQPAAGHDPQHPLVVFACHFETSPGTCLTSAAFSGVCHEPLLRESDLSIQQIADSLDYSDVFFFHRQFRRFAGATPRAVRQGAGSCTDDLREKL